MQKLQHFLAKQSHKHVRSFIVCLIAILSLVRVFQMDGGNGFDPRSYDQLVKHRLWGPVVEEKIIIVDIDERSLDKMRGEFGRWPWPRETLASVLEWVNQQGAQAVVFDILFADPDTLNPASDLAFVQAVSQSNNSYFPVLRLNPENDALSKIRANQVPGFASAITDSHTSPAPTLALVLPNFEALTQSGRLGYHNIYADEDGVNRSYRLWEDKQGWRLWSLPARLAKDLHWSLPIEAKQLIHYTRDKDAYTQVSFSDIWQLSQSQKGLQKDVRFENAIVLVGSTATSLFDVKVTPVDTTHPGVMILANVIDNLKNHSFLHIASKWAQLLVAWLGLALVVWASTQIREDHIKWAAAAAPALFLAIGFASLHSGSNLYWDLSQSASNALLFFTVWGVYLNWRSKFLGRFVQDASPPISPCDCTAVISVNFADTDMQVVLDGLSSLEGVGSIVRIGATHQAPYTGIGLIHIATMHHDENLHQKINALPFKPLNTFVNASHSDTLNCDQLWRRIWSDIHFAEQHWNFAHDKH
jgi:adenylate cyclase